MRASIEIRGEKHLWSLDLANVTPENLRDWQEDGLDVCEVVEQIPVDDWHLDAVSWWVRQGVEQ